MSESNKRKSPSVSVVEVHENICPGTQLRYYLKATPEIAALWYAGFCESMTDNGVSKISAQKSAQAIMERFFGITESELNCNKNIVGWDSVN